MCHIVCMGERGGERRERERGGRRDIGSESAIARYPYANKVL